jgi:SAM-dependent methyltransferase
MFNNRGHPMVSNDTLHLGCDAEGNFFDDEETYMPDIWGWVCLEFTIRSVLDVGCGIGSNLAWFDEYGFDVLGVEGHPNAIANSKLPGKVVQHDFVTGPWVPDRHFDLGICTEFAEHVEAAYEHNWLSALTVCSFILFAHALPGQGGYHHVNEQSSEYWIERFKGYGIENDTKITDMLRATCLRKPAAWGRNTIMFYRRCAT